jgi:hypothetical protein
VRRDLLFFTFWAFFVIAFLVTVIGICGGLTLDAEAKKPLIYALIVEVAGAVVAVYRNTDFLKADDESAKKNANRIVAALKTDLELKQSELDSIKSEHEAENRAYVKNVSDLKHECVQLTNAKDEALKRLDEYKGACYRDVARLKSEIEQLKGTAPAPKLSQDA